MLAIFSDCGCLGRMPVSEENQGFFELALRISKKGQTMKYRIFITKKEILTAIIFIVGLILFGKGLHAAYQCHHALDLNTMQEYEIKEGAYVTGNIDTYIGKHVYGNNKFFGLSQSYLNLLGKSYDFYTIPVGKKSYICIMAYSKSLLKQLEAFEEGHGEAILFEGKIIESPIDINLAWHASIDGFRMESLITSFVIVEKDFGKNKDTIYIGIFLLVVAAIRFFGAGGLKNVVLEDPEDERPVTQKSGYRYEGKQQNTKQRYDSDYELQAEQMRLDTLERRFHELKRSALLCIALLPAGCYILYRFSLLFGILLIVISIKSIWRYFINSANTAAKFLVRKCNLKSLSVQIEECEENIEKLIF